MEGRGRRGPCVSLWRRVQSVGEKLPAEAKDQKQELREEGAEDRDGETKENVVGRVYAGILVRIATDGQLWRLYRRREAERVVPTGGRKRAMVPVRRRDLAAVRGGAAADGVALDVAACGELGFDEQLDHNDEDISDKEKREQDLHRPRMELVDQVAAP